MITMMRLDPSRIGLFAGLLGVVTGQHDSGPAFINFGGMLTTEQVFVKSQGPVDILWTTADNLGLVVTNVNLYHKGAGGGVDVPIAQSSHVPDFHNDQQDGQKADIGNSKRQLPTLPTNGLGSGNGQTIIPFDGRISYFNERWNSDIFYMEFDLGNDTYTGKGYSPPFAVIDDETLRDDANDILMDEPVRVKQDEVGPRSNTTASAGSPASPTPSPTAPSPSLGAGVDTTDSVGDGRSGDGLSPGAIAGIVVGISIGVLAVVGLSVWFCLRRRQSGRPLVRARSAGYGSDSGAIVMMPEKEGTGLAESSSHPAYNRPSAPAAHNGSPTVAAGSYAPYSDHMAAAVATSAPTSLNEPSPLLHEQQGPGGEAGAARQHQQQPIASRYAHLVEEGMTEDEIQRLEEEERQLDAAIEQAGHRPGQARQ